MGGSPRAASLEAGAVGRYAVGVAVLVLAITSQYFVPQTIPGARAIYGTLAGDLAIVYGIPIVAFVLLVGVEPLRRWNADPRRAPVLGLGWYGAMGLLALVVTVGLLIVYEAVDPGALQLLSRPNPVLQAASGDPWFFVGLSFVVGAFEEAIFRGWIFGFWMGRTRSWMMPAVLSSVLFAGLHLYYGTTYGAASPVIFPTLFLAGFGFAATYRVTGGNLVVPAALHGLYDASAYLTLVSGTAGLAVRYLPMVAGAICALAFGLGLSPDPPSPVVSSWPGLGAPTWSSAAPDASGPMPPTDDELRRVLTGARTIAVVGLSDKPDRDSNEVARYLQGQGYRVVPVNPAVSEVLGERSYLSLADVPPEIHVDVAVIFRRDDAVPPIVDEAIARGVPVVWMQLGVEHAVAAAKARAHGLLVVENTCSMATLRRLKIPPVRGPA